MQEFQKGILYLGSFEQFKKKNEAIFTGFSDAEISFQYNRLLQDEIWINDLYQVNVDRMTHKNSPVGLPIVHLSIKRIDKEIIHDWRELQEIKNAILGPEIDAVEVYPAESRRIDMANQYHLWCLPEGNLFPVGWNDRNVTDQVADSNTKQRSLESVDSDQK